MYIFYGICWADNICDGVMYQFRLLFYYNSTYKQCISKIYFHRLYCRLYRVIVPFLYDNKSNKIEMNYYIETVDYKDDF